MLGGVKDGICILTYVGRRDLPDFAFLYLPGLSVLRASAEVHISYPYLPFCRCGRNPERGRKHRLLSSNRQIKVHHKNFHYGREIMLRLASCNKIVLILFPTLLLTAPVFSQDKPDTDETANLQKATQNPVASLISVPVQNNSNFDIPPNKRTQDVLNIQPVIPIGVAKDWNLIIRWITPTIWQPDPSVKDIGFYGIGDMQPTFFLSPKKTGKVIWGVGPYFILPTATNPFLGQGKFSLGPSVVALVQPGHWTIGALVNNAWSVAGPSDRANVNQMLLQYFINYNLEKGWFLTWSPIVTANWQAASGNVWTVPVGGGVGRVFRLGFQPVSLAAQVYGNAARPAGTSSWTLRLQMAFLFPKIPKRK